MPKQAKITKPVASLSLDLDNKWSYMKTHGDSGWEDYPTYLDIVVPRVLEFLKKRDLNITFFIVGQDAALKKNREAIAMISAAGHEVGNHSFNHEPWLHLYSREEIESDIGRTEEAIEKVTGARPYGFRGPGYSLSPTVLRVLSERGYRYDCSTLPTYIGPFARAYYFLRSPKMSADEREKRGKLFGTFADGAQTLRSHRWNVDGKELVEIPVTTLPIFKTPIHASYIIYLSAFSKRLALTYWRTAMSMCKQTGIEPSLLLHPLDFMTEADTPELKFFPGMNLPLESKLKVVSDMLAAMQKKFEIVNMNDHALIAAKYAVCKSRAVIANNVSEVA